MKKRKQPQTLCCEIPRPAVLLKTPDRILCSATTVTTKEEFLKLSRVLLAEIPDEHYPLTLHFFASEFMQSAELSYFTRFDFLREVEQ